MTASVSAPSLRQNQWPHVSVLVPVRNEEQFIAQTLEAILAQDYPGPLQILVIDGMSNDQTPHIVQKIAEAHPQVELLENPACIVSAALNVGVANAKGEILLRVDGRSLLPPQYIVRCVSLLMDTGAANVGGMQVPIATTYQGRAVAAAMDSPFGVGPARFRFGRRLQEVDTVYLGAWPRWVFEKVGAFDETQVRNQDYEFNYRLRMAGGTILFSPELKVAYAGRPTIAKLWRQYFLYGYWKARVILMHPRSTRPRQLAAPLLVLGLVVGLLLGLVTGGLIWTAYLVSLISYALLVLVFSVVQAVRHGPELVPLLPLVFLTLHLGWGIGFWLGVGRWWFVEANRKSENRATQAQ